MYRIVALVLVLAATLPHRAVSASACSHWGKPYVAGILNSSVLAEVSGVTASNAYPDRLYHVNDSGISNRFIITDLQGQAAQEITIRNLRTPIADAEDISTGPCANQQQCIYIADIGDNSRRRDAIQVIVLAEQEHYQGPVTPVLQLTLEYPDGPHNAEGLAAHPNGDIYILTKELHKEQQNWWHRITGKPRQYQASPARLYKLQKKDLTLAIEQKHTLSLLGEIDLPSLLSKQSNWPLSYVATGFSIAPDGETFLVLTYTHALEFSHHFLGHTSTSQTPVNAHAGKHQLIAVNRLPYQEGITYLADGNSIVYHTEYVDIPQTLMRIDCIK